MRPLQKLAAFLCLAAIVSALLAGGHGFFWILVAPFFFVLEILFISLSTLPLNSVRIPEVPSLIVCISRAPPLASA